MKNVTHIRTALLAASALAALAPAAAFAQQAAPATANSQEEDIVVTGTSIGRASFETPLAVSTLDEGALRRLTATSQADILNTVPTIKADGGGGEVAANVFIKGLPSGGQYQFTPLMYDGMPALSTFGLNSSAFDVYVHNDIGIERLEFVRGGVSNLFGAGSVAGLINYISRTGSDERQGTAQLEWAERGRMRGDLAMSGPLGGGWFYAFSGYYRADEGPVRSGLDTKGYQVRGNLKKEFANGNITFYGQRIDDQVQFYLPIPLDGPTRNRLKGNDGKTVYSVQHNNLSTLGFMTPAGMHQTKIADGVLTQGGLLAASFDFDMGNDWGVNGRVKYSDYTHRFGLWSDGDGVVNVPETQTRFLANRSLGDLANAKFSFADGSAVPSNFLLFANRFTDRERPATDMTAEVNITKKLETGGVTHALTLGAFHSDAEAEDVNVTTTFLAEFNNQPRLVNLVVTNPATGAQTIVANKGLLNAGAGYTNNKHTAKRSAIYFADQMETDRWVFDVGFRYEGIDGTIRRERSAAVITDSTTPNLSAALRDVIWGNGSFQTAKVSTSSWAGALGALYRLNDNVNLFANAARGFFFPEIRSVTFNSLGVAASFKPEVIKQAEAGVKFRTDRVSGSVSGLYTSLKNRRQVLFVNDGVGGFTEKVNLVSTESYGLEAVVDVKLVENLKFSGNMTLQHHEFTGYDSTPGNIGKELARQPNLLYNAGLYYDDGTFDASLFTNYTGSNYTSDANTILLKGFNVANLDVGYRIPMGGNSARISFNVFNLLNSDATTEGSPRQDASQTVGAYFVGRPVLPRRLTARLSYSF